MQRYGLRFIAKNSLSFVPGHCASHHVHHLCTPYLCDTPLHCRCFLCFHRYANLLCTPYLCTFGASGSFANPLLCFTSKMYKHGLMRCTHLIHPGLYILSVLKSATSWGGKVQRTGECAPLHLYTVGVSGV